MIWSVNLIYEYQFNIRINFLMTNQFRDSSAWSATKCDIEGNHNN